MKRFLRATLEESVLRRPKSTKGIQEAVLRFLSCCIFAWAFPGLAALEHTPEAGASKIEIIDAQFGIVEETDEGKSALTPTNEVPLIENQTYGWIIQLKLSHAGFKWREEFTLPAAPERWGNGAGKGRHEVSDDRKVSVIEKVVTGQEGLLFNFWSVAPGDPVGAHLIKVYVDDVLIRTFEFTVKKPLGCAL